MKFLFTSFVGLVLANFASASTLDLSLNEGQIRFTSESNLSGYKIEHELTQFGAPRAILKLTKKLDGSLVNPLAIGISISDPITDSLPGRIEVSVRWEPDFYINDFTVIKFYPEANIFFSTDIGSTNIGWQTAYASTYFSAPRDFQVALTAYNIGAAVYSVPVDYQACSRTTEPCERMDLIDRGSLVVSISASVPESSALTLSIAGGGLVAVALLRRRQRAVSPHGAAN